jgi:hypothetical protein
MHTSEECRPSWIWLRLRSTKWMYRFVAVQRSIGSFSTSCSAATSSASADASVLLREYLNDTAGTKQ